uniref:Apoptosis inhibitor 5-A-like n=1 Tax=Hirondellea gigas TaxID=1518452 RepID=A0A2P2HWS6_9CRUS
MVSVERLYELYNTISDAKDNAGKHETEFEEILGGVKGDVGARRMTAQFISRYFGTFPNQEEKSLNALFDLCEDDDSSIRRQSITSLGVVCRGKAALVPKVADILAQLLQMDDPAEVNCVNAALVALLRVHAKGCLTGLFYQLDNNRDEVIRGRVLHFLLNKVQSLSTDVFNKEVQIFIFTEAKKFIPNANEEELVLIMSVLGELSVCRTTTGQQQLANLLMTQVDLTKPLLQAEQITKTLATLTQARNFFSSNVKSTEVVQFLFTQGLPCLEQIEAALLLAGQQDAAAVTLSLLKLLASLLTFTETVEKPEDAMKHVLKALLDVLPLPPAAGESGWEDGGASLQFSRVECLLYTLHFLIKHHKDFFSDADVLGDFRKRLQYFARGSQAYQKVLREALQGKKGEELKTEENKIKLIALKTTANINTLIKDFFHSPPAAKSTIALSWHLDEDKSKSVEGAAVGFKRHAPITVESDSSAPAAKQMKGSRQIYAPPRDKFSGGQTFTGGAGRGGGGRGRGGRGFRRY